MKKYLRHPVVQNALALYSVQFAEYLLPMVTIPYLARVLQPAGWGTVVYAQNFSSWLILVLEYGFGFSATREIARRRDEPGQCAEVVGGVVGADVLLLAPAILMALIARFTAPEFREHPGYLWLALVIAATQGLRPFWFFQGLESMKFPAWLNVGGRALYTIGIFLFVASTRSGWVVLALQAVSGGIVTVIIAGAMYRLVSFAWPTFGAAITALKRGWTIFLSRSAVSLYALANTFILGFFVNSTQVAYYGGAERIIVMVNAMTGPFLQALYPRMSHLAMRDRRGAAQAARMSLFAFVVGGFAMGGAVFAAAPLIVRILFGPSYTPAIPLLRVSSLIVPMVAVSNILGMQWMLPLGMDRMFNRIVVSAGILNVILAVSLSWRFGAMGTACSVVVSQSFVTAGMWISLARSGRGFWSDTPEDAVAGAGNQV